MKTKLLLIKSLFIIVVMSLIASCDLDLPDDPMLTLNDIEVDAVDSNVETMIIGEFNGYQYIKIPFEANYSLPESIKFNASMDNSDVPEGAIDLEDVVYLHKGYDKQNIEILMDCSKIPQGSVNYSFDLVLDGVNKEVETSTIHCTIIRDMPDPIYTVYNNFWYQISGSWYQGEATNNFGAWAYVALVYYAEPNLEVGGGIWQRNATDLVLETYSTPAAYFSSDGKNYLEFLEEGDKINQESFDWIAPGDINLKPAVHPDDFGKSGYLALRPKIYDTQVNMWVYVTISEDGRNMIIHEVAWEDHGLSINAGQK
ncbi:MAG: hypothetical protein N4A71_23815 [Carboxylicivirga sp.]|jgi:hypothetical protein|nr:hypothetical protein [Carboxylicivirga sp.]